MYLAHQNLVIAFNLLKKAIILNGIQFPTSDWTVDKMKNIHKLDAIQMSKKIRETRCQSADLHEFFFCF